MHRQWKKKKKTRKETADRLCPSRIVMKSIIFPFPLLFPKFEQSTPSCCCSWPFCNRCHWPVSATAAATGGFRVLNTIIANIGKCSSTEKKRWRPLHLKDWKQERKMIGRGKQHPCALVAVPWRRRWVRWQKTKVGKCWLRARTMGEYFRAERNHESHE